MDLIAKLKEHPYAVAAGVGAVGILVYLKTRGSSTATLTASTSPNLRGATGTSGPGSSVSPNTAASQANLAGIAQAQALKASEDKQQYQLALMSLENQRAIATGQQNTALEVARIQASSKTATQQNDAVMAFLKTLFGNPQKPGTGQSNNLGSNGQNGKPYKDVDPADGTKAPMSDFPGAQGYLDGPPPDGSSANPGSVYQGLAGGNGLLYQPSNEGLGPGTYGDYSAGGYADWYQNAANFDLSGLGPGLYGNDYGAWNTEYVDPVSSGGLSGQGYDNYSDDSMVDWG